MPKIEVEEHGIRLLNKFSSPNEKVYFDELKKYKMPIKVHFVDGTTIKGVPVRFDTYQIFLAHKQNLLLIQKGNIKLIEPLPSKKDKEAKASEEIVKEKITVK